MNAGGEELQIVCGAPNARAGIKVVLARPGTVIPATGDALKIGKIRDVESRGRTPRSVMAQFFTHVRAMHEAHVEPQRALADLVIVCPYEAGPDHADASAAQIAERLT